MDVEGAFEKEFAIAIKKHQIVCACNPPFAYEALPARG